MHVDSEGFKSNNDADYSGIINKMKNYLLEYYQPVQEPRDADFHFSTQEIWTQLLKLCPAEYILKQETVANWLHLGGFTFHDYGELRLDWMMKKR